MWAVHYAKGRLVLNNNNYLHKNPWANVKKWRHWFWYYWNSRKRSYGLVYTASKISVHVPAHPLETVYTKICKRICKQNVNYQKQIKFHRSDQWIIISDEIREKLNELLLLDWWYHFLTVKKGHTNHVLYYLEWVKMMS